MGGMQACDEVEEVTRRRRRSIEGITYCRQPAPCDSLSGQEKNSEQEGCSDPRNGAAQSRLAQSQPLLEHVDLAEDMHARPLDAQAAQQENGGIEIENRRQAKRGPVAREFVGAGIHRQACLTREKGQNQHGKKEHVRGEGRKKKKSDAMETLARAAPLILPVVVPAAATSAGWPAGHR